MAPPLCFGLAHFDLFPISNKLDKLVLAGRSMINTLVKSEIYQCEGTWRLNLMASHFAPCAFITFASDLIIV